MICKCCFREIEVRKNRFMSHGSQPLWILGELCNGSGREVGKEQETGLIRIQGRPMKKRRR